MNPKLIGKIIGGALLLEAVLMLLPLGCSVVHGEDLKLFVIPMLIEGAVGGILYFIADKDRDIVSREGFISTGLTWITLSLTGMLPFLISGAMTNPIDAFFETVSGFTTTGATVLTDLESLPKGLLMWTSFLHWIGGMGILVFMSAIMHFARGSQINLVKAESTGPIVSKLVPKADSTAKVLYGIYTAMSVITLIILLILKMPLFDAICLTFSAAGTGGFGVLNDSCASYTIAQQVALNTATMFFGVSFTLYFLILMGKFKLAVKNEELRLYLLIFALATIFITVDLMAQGDGAVNGGPLMALHRAAFNVGTIMTTTGFAIEDCNYWPGFSQCILVILMISGACAGSTGGGIKVSRLNIMLKAFNKEMAIHLRPEQVKKIHIDGKPVEDSVIRNTGTFCFLWMFFIIMSILVVSIDGKEWNATITSVISAFGNVGPGFGENGTMGNYSSFSNLSKLVLSADMLIGRLEIYPILALFKRNTWKCF